MFLVSYRCTTPTPIHPVTCVFAFFKFTQNFDLLAFWLLLLTVFGASVSLCLFLMIGLSSAAALSIASMVPGCVCFCYEVLRLFSGLMFCSLS